MKLTLNKTFEKREDLDAFISTRVGTNTAENIDHELEITSEEAEKLGLSNNVKVHGVKVKVK